MKKRRLIPLILASATCFLLSFAFLNTGKSVAPAVNAEEQVADLTLSSFQMYNGAQIRLPLNAQGETKANLGNTLRFMGVVEQDQYEAIEAKYGEGAGENDTTEWGMVFVQRTKMEDEKGNLIRPLDAATVFGYVDGQDDTTSRKYYWMKDTKEGADWATDAIGGVATQSTTEDNYVQGGKSMFTPVRYDNLKALSLNQWGTLINKNLSIDGKSGAPYYVISGYVPFTSKSQYTTEVVGRAYVRYVDENDQVVYKFADYSGGHMDNNTRSMTYVAQKYMESDETKADNEKVYVDNTGVENTNGQNNTVNEFIDETAKTGYSIEYHFVDADNKSIMPSPVVVEAKDSKYTVNDLISMSAFEIIDMCQSEDLKIVAERYGAQIDWYNPYKVTVSKAYANSKTTFKLYYANDDYANASNAYDVLSDYGTYDKDPAVSWYYESSRGMGGVTDRSTAQYDKAYTLADDTYRPTYCAEGHSYEDCVHICDAPNCNSPNHGHVSHYIETKLYNNTLLVTAMDKNNLMQFTDDGKYLSGGVNFADYEYVLLRFYSSIGGINISLITGSTTITTVNGTEEVPVTSGEKYTIIKGWNRIKLDGKKLQEVIDAYKTANGGGLMKDDEEAGRQAVYSPYRNGQYLQFIVDDTYVYGSDNHLLSNAQNWSLYFEDTIGVKDRERSQLLGYGSFEQFLTDEEAVGKDEAQYLTKNDVHAEGFIVSINDDPDYVYSGKKSLKLVDSRSENGWMVVDLKLEYQGEIVTLAQLSQMDVTIQVYCSHEVIFWFGGCVWTDNMKIKPNAWNTIRMNGWRMVDAILNIAKDHVAYDETTGLMRFYFAEVALGESATFYIDNIKASFVNRNDNVVELDDFVTLPTRTEKLSAPKLIANAYPKAGVGAPISEPTEVENVPFWFAIDEELNNTNNKIKYTYEVKKNNSAATYIDFGEVEGKKRYRENSLGDLLDSWAVRAVETEKDAQGNVVKKRYSDWTYYEWTPGKEDVLWNSYVALYEANHTEFPAPVVTLHENGVVTWTTIAGAENGYACYINNVRVYDTKRTQATLKDGDSFSVRVITYGAYAPSLYTRPVVYHEGVVGETVEKYNENSGEYVESGKTIYDIPAMQSLAFKETARIPSPASNGGYAWKIVMGAKNNGLFLLPLTIGGQPLTNSQLLSADYIDLLVYAGANNKNTGYINFNGKVPPAEDSVLIPGQWNTIRISTRAIYDEIQLYKDNMYDENGRAHTAPYTNGNSPYDGSPLSRLCGYAMFQVAGAAEDDYWIIDSARLVYNSSTYQSSNASYWFTQHDYETMPISAYNALPPHSNYFDDAIADLTKKLNEATTEEDRKYYQASLENIQNMANALKEYDTLNHEALLDFYVDCGINTMMGLYDYANYSSPGHDYVVNMLKECAERDLSYLIAWMGGTTFTEELLDSQDGKIMKEWLLEYATYAAFAGVMLTDEPGAVAYDNILEARETFEKYWGKDALYHVNLLPNWAGSDAWLNFKNPDTTAWWEGGYTYEKYIQEYLRIYNPQVLSFDMYPFVGNTNANYSTLLNPGDLSRGDHISADNSSISVNYEMATEGNSSLLVSLEDDRWVNIGTGGLTYEQMTTQFSHLLMDIYNGGADATIRFHDGTTIIVKTGWHTYEIPTTINKDIINESGVQTNNSGYIYFLNKTGAKIYLTIDNVRGITPVGAQRFLRKGYYQNLATMRDESIKANIPFWTYIQTTTWYEGGILPTKEELRWNINTSLAYGAKGIQYFTGVQPYDAGGEKFAGGLFDKAGKPTDIYGYAKRVNMFIQSIDHVLMNSRSLGVVFVGDIPQFATVHSNSLYSPLTAAENAAEIPDKGTLTVEQAGFSMMDANGSALIGCFDYNGKKAYYVVNNSTTSIADVNLAWGDKANGHTITLYGTEASHAWVPLIAEDATAETMPANATKVSSATKGKTITSDTWDRVYIRNMAPGEAVFFVVE